MILGRRILAWFLFALLVFPARAQTTFTWSGAGGNPNFSTPGNWVGGVAPTGNGSENIIFPNLPLTLEEMGNYYASLNSAVSIGNLTFNGQYYSFYLSGTGPITLNGNITANNVATSNVPLVLAAGNHVISGTSYVFQSEIVSGTGSLTVNGGNLGMFSPGNTYSGGTTLNSGQLLGYHNNTFGTGTVTLNGGTLSIYPSTATVRLANNFVLGANVSFTTSDENGSAGIGDASHTIAPAAGVSTVNLSLLYGSSPLYLAGAMLDGSGSTTYTFANPSGNSTFYLTGNNTYTGGTLVKNGAAVIFETTGSVPASGLISAQSDGYAGVGNNGVLGSLLGRVDPANFAGTIGIDSGVAYTGNINLAGFTGAGAQVSLGTLDTATISGLITPSSAAAQYRFRSSGTLFLTGSNPLSGNNGVYSSSFANRDPGLLVLSQSVPNTYTGAAIANGGGGIIFDSAGSKPSGTALELHNGGYIGFTETSGLTLDNLVDSVANQVGIPGVLGIDSHNTVVNGFYTSYTYSSAIDLGDLSDPVYLGTSSNVTVNGSLSTTDDGTDNYYLTGYKYGTLTVNSHLTGSKSVNVGLPGLNEYGTVKLTNTGNNYSGGTVINSGGLIVSAPSALGSGAITVDTEQPYQTVILEGPSNTTLSNNIILNSGALEVYWSGSTFSGAISGSGSLYVSSDLTLTGANSYSGGTIVDYIRVTGTTNGAIGTGPLSVINGGSMIFTTTAPHIGSLLEGGYFDDGDGTERSATLVLTHASGGTLTINQTDEGNFDGIIAQGGAAPVALVKEGAGALTISGATGPDNDYTTPYAGGTTINQGRLVAGSVNALGSGAVVINNGASLGTAPGVVLSNTINFGAGGGTLSGNGTFATPITVGANVILAPGDSPGTLTFSSGLTLASGGTLEFQVQSAAGPAGTGYDLVNISGALLNITATTTTGSQFKIKLTSLDFYGEPGDVYDFSAGMGYSWLVFESAAGITGFDPNKFEIDDDDFSNSGAADHFSLSLGTNGPNQAIYLNFTPVPEPSTWALLGGGLAALGFGAWRRRRS